MRNRTRNIALLLFCGLTSTGCTTAPHPPEAKAGLVRQENQGYSLLYKLMSDESSVGQIFILKNADAPVESVVKQISDFCKDAKTQMDQFAKSDSILEYDLTDLPDIEQKSRDLQAKDETGALLFSSGKEFELRLIFTQAEAMNYAVQLSKALAAHEADAARKSFLLEIAHRGGEFHDQLMGLLEVKP